MIAKPTMQLVLVKLFLIFFLCLKRTFLSHRMNDDQNGLKTINTMDGFGVADRPHSRLHRIV